MKSRWAATAILVLFVFSLVPAQCSDTDTQVASVSESDDNWLSDLVTHSPITITSDSDFITQGWSGTGTQSNPFIIEDLHIVTEGTCVTIVNTTYFFIIRNCNLTATGYDGICVDMDQCENGVITDCFLNGWDYAVNVYSSSYITISRSTFGYSDFGIDLQVSDNCSVLDNDFQDSDVSSRFSRNNIISGNTISNGRIDVWMSRGDLVENNIVTDASIGGIMLGYASECNINGNTVSVSRTGIELYWSQDCSVSDNIISHSEEGGIWLQHSERCVLTNNSLSTNSGVIFNTDDPRGGTPFYDEPLHWNHTITENSVNGKPLGYFVGLRDQTVDAASYGQVILVSCTNVVVKDGLFNGSVKGVQVGFCSDTEISDCISDYQDDSIYLYKSNRCIVKDITTRNSRYGVRIYLAEDCIVTQCLFLNYLMGVSIASSFNCSVTDSCIHQSNDGVLVIRSVEGMISNNTIFSKVESFYGKGLEVYESTNYQIMSNVISLSYIGISHVNSHSSTIIDNVVYACDEYGLFIHSSENNTIHSNSIGWNGISNAVDFGLHNNWDDGMAQGNRWSNYTGTGEYDLPGSGGSIDHYPEYLTDSGPPQIVTPAQIQYNDNPLSVSITWVIDEEFPTYYTLKVGNGLIVNITDSWCGSEIEIELTSLPAGTHRVDLMVYDAVGNRVTDTVLVTIGDGDAFPIIYGVILLFAAIGVCGVGIAIYVFKIKKP